MEYPLISYPIWRRIVHKIIISSPIITHMMNMRTIVRSTIGMIMIRHTEIEQAAIRIIDINPETPSSSGDINGTIEILSSQESAVLRIAQHPTKIIVANIQRFIVIIQCPLITPYYIIHNITKRINEIIVNLIHVIILGIIQVQFVCHLISKETCLLTYLAGTHSRHYSGTGSHD